MLGSIARVAEFRHIVTLIVGVQFMLAAVMLVAHVTGFVPAIHSVLASFSGSVANRPDDPLRRSGQSDADAGQLCRIRHLSLLDPLPRRRSQHRDVTSVGPR